MVVKWNVRETSEDCVMETLAKDVEDIGRDGNTKEKEGNNQEAGLFKAKFDSKDGSLSESSGSDSSFELGIDASAWSLRMPQPSTSAERGLACEKSVASVDSDKSDESDDGNSDSEYTVERDSDVSGSAEGTFFMIFFVQ